jgi:hypothetical protein
MMLMLAAGPAGREVEGEEAMFSTRSFASICAAEKEAAVVSVDARVSGGGFVAG